MIGLKHTLPALALTLLGTGACAQQATEQPVASLQQARAALRLLDEAAADCVQETAGATSCQVFLQALNGAPLADYIAHCETARTWRTGFVASRTTDNDSAASDAAISVDSDTLLEWLVETEFLCGDQALERATEHVLGAYRLTRSGSTTALENRLQGWRQQQTLEAERARQQQRLSSQRQRTEQQTGRQFEQLELELLRQQTLPRYGR